MAKFDNLLVEQTRNYTNEQGAVTVSTYEGTKAELLIVARYFERLGEGAPAGYGFRTRLDMVPGKYRLTIWEPDPESFSETWRISTNLRSVDWTASPYVKGYIPEWAALDLRTVADVEKFNKRVGFVNGAVNKLQSGTKDPFTVPPGAFPNGPFTAQELELITHLILTSRQTHYYIPNLHRRRMLSVSSSDRVKINGIARVWQTADLITDFSIPSDIAAQISTVDADLPAAEPGTIWAWGGQANSVELEVGTARYREEMTWTFDKYPLSLYELA